MKFQNNKHMKPEKQASEAIIHNDTFYHDLESLAESTEEDIKDMDDDDYITVEETSLEPLFYLDADFIIDNIDEERLSEDCDELDKARKVLNENIDFDKINALLPKLHYPNGKKTRITKQELLELL